MFINLNKLQAGDRVQIETDQDELLTFRVLNQEIYDYKQAPNEKIFNITTAGPY